VYHFGTVGRPKTDDGRRKWSGGNADDVDFFNTIGTVGRRKMEDGSGTLGRLCGLARTKPQIAQIDTDF